MRVVWAFCGVLSVCFGTLGILLPLLPTVPFLLLAAFCFARSSPQLHRWLVNHPTFGPPIRDWADEGAISRGAKIAATISVAVVFSASLILGVQWLLLGIQAAVLTAVLTFIWTRPDGSR